MISFLRTILFGIALISCTARGNDLLVGSYFGDSISRYETRTGKFLGNLTGGNLSGPLAFRVGPDKLLYVCSEKNNSVLRFSLETFTYIDTVASGNHLNHPAGIAFDSRGNLLIGCFESNSVEKVSKKGKYQSKLVTDGLGGLKGPDVGLTVGPDGKLYVPSFYSDAVLRFDPNTGKFLDEFIPAKRGGLTQPRTILFRDKKVWVSSDSGNKVLRFALDGRFIDTFVEAGAGGLKGASGMAFGDDGLLYVTSWRNNSVLRFNISDGKFVDKIVVAGLKGPTFLALIPGSSKN